MKKISNWLATIKAMFTNKTDTTNAQKPYTSVVVQTDDRLKRNLPRIRL